MNNLTSKIYKQMILNLFHHNPNWFENLDEIFPIESESIMRTRFDDGNYGFFIYDNSLYTISSDNVKEISMRTSEFFHETIEKYNLTLINMDKIEYKNIDPTKKVYISHWDDGSESVTINEVI